MTDPAREVSAHYLIGRDGIIYQLVDERARAWHAGKSQWGSDTDLNSSSLGIELDNNGREPFSDAQIIALIALLDDIKRRYDIPTANFLGHSDIAPERKIDPSRYFPWKTLSERGFGLWCDSPPVELPSSFDTAEALQALGYDVSNTEAAISQYRRACRGAASVDKTCRCNPRLNSRTAEDDGLPAEPKKSTRAYSVY